MDPFAIETTYEKFSAYITYLQGRKRKNVSDQGTVEAKESQTWNLKSLKIPPPIYLRLRLIDECAQWWRETYEFDCSLTLSLNLALKAQSAKEAQSVDRCHTKPIQKVE